MAGFMLFFRNPNEARRRDVMRLGIIAGVMIAATLPVAVLGHF